MAQITRYLVAIIVFSMVNSFSCNKEHPFMANCIITGYDARMCPCCGGLMLTFTEKTKPYQGEFYMVQNKDSELGISRSTVFPVYLKVDYAEVPGCGGKGVRIIKYSKQN